MTKKIRLEIFFTFMCYSVAGLAAGAKPASGDVVAAHSFDRGPEAWHTGKDKTHTRGVTWHRNILGFYGEPVFLKWSEREAVRRGSPIPSRPGTSMTIMVISAGYTCSPTDTRSLRSREDPEVRVPWWVKTCAMPSSECPFAGGTLS